MDNKPQIKKESLANTEAPQRKNKKLIIIAAVALVALLFVAIAVYFLSINKNPKPVVNNTNSTKDVTPKMTKISVIEEGKLVLPKGHADPTVVKTASGYRMYVNRQSGGPTGILIYSSPDGVTWTQEKDIILPGASTTRAVVFPTGIRIYYPGAQPIKAEDPPANMYSTFSEDGLNFTQDSGIRIEPRSSEYYIEGPTVFQLADKSWRMYFNENTVAAAMQRDGEIWGASSPDGITWTRDDKPTITAGDEEAMQGNMPAPWKQVLHPFVLDNPKGGYIMFYNSHSEIYAATSDDGKTWKKIGKIGVHGADMDGYFQDDGTIRAYYGDFNPEDGGLVYTAVLKVE